MCDLTCHAEPVNVPLDAPEGGLVQLGDPVVLQLERPQRARVAERRACHLADVVVVQPEAGKKNRGRV